MGARAARRRRRGALPRSTAREQDSGENAPPLPHAAAPAYRPVEQLSRLSPRAPIRLSSSCWPQRLCRTSRELPRAPLNNIPGPDGTRGLELREDEGYEDERLAVNLDRARQHPRGGAYSWRRMHG
jgi:hypothetical protein